MIYQTIIPHLWFNKEAKEAAEFYTSIFPDSKVTGVKELHDTPSGDANTVTFEIMGYKMIAISAGPFFTFTPAISMMINFDPSQDEHARKRIDEVWEKLSEGGKELMPLEKYPFSERYGWIQDKYGFSWQLIYTNPEGEERPPVIPSLLYITNTCEQAEEATNFYLDVFRGAPSALASQVKRGAIARYPAGMEPNKEGSIMFTDFMLLGQWFAAMDSSAKMHQFTFTEAISLMVHCDTQEEIDYYWEKMSAVPESEQCGWLKDKFGVSWQIVPTALGRMLQTTDQEQLSRVTQAFLKMKKFNIAELQRAYDGK